MDPNVSAFLQPLDQHLKAVVRKLISQPRSLDIVMTEVRCCMVFAFAASVTFRRHEKVS